MNAGLLFSLLLIGLVCIKLYSKVIRPASLTLLDLLYLPCGLVFGIQSLFIFFYFGRDIDYFSPATLTKVYLAVFLFLIAIEIMSVANSKVLSKYHTKLDLTRVTLKAFIKGPALSNLGIILVLGYCVAIRLYMGFNFGIFFSGTATEENILGLPYYLVMLSQFGRLFENGLVLCLFILISTNKPRGGRRKILFGCALVFLFIINFSEGRRWLLAFFAQGYLVYLFSLGRFRFRILVSALIVGLIFIFILIPGFLNIRDVYLGELSTGDKNVLRQFPFLGIWDSEKNSIYSEQLSPLSVLADNLVARGTATSFIGDIFEAQKVIPPMHGMALQSVFKWAVPRSLSPRKTSLLPTEQLIQLHYGLPLRDQQITWIALGIADYGIIGGFSAGIVIAALIILLGLFGIRVYRRTPFVALSLIGTLISFIIVFEEDPVVLLAIGRNSLAIWVIAYLIHLIRKEGVRTIMKRSFAQRTISDWK